MAKTSEADLLESQRAAHIEVEWKLIPSCDKRVGNDEGIARSDWAGK